MQQNKSVIIAGASGGIGEALARSLRDTEVSLYLIARPGSGVSSLAEELGASYKEAEVDSFEQMEGAFKEAKDTLGEIDGVVNCCGSVLLKPAHLTSSEEFHTTVNKNLTTAFSVLRATTKINVKGSLVLFSTAAVRIGLPNHEAIAAAKAGVEGLVRSAASGYSGKGLRVNAVAPGLTRTPLTSRITENEQALKISMGMHAIPRPGEPEDIVSAVKWLLSPSQSWVTGQILAVDGGLSTLRAR